MSRAGAATYSVTAPVWLWNADKGSWHFVTISGDAANEIRFDSMGLRSGFGSVKVLAEISGVQWATSLFPSGDGYILPLKADVRRRAKIASGDEISVNLRLALGA